MVDRIYTADVLKQKRVTKIVGAALQIRDILCRNQIINPFQPSGSTPLPPPESESMLLLTL